MTELDRIAVCQVWGEIGLRCMRTDDEQTRKIGIGLLDSLQQRQYATDAKLTAPAEAVLDWMQETCNHEGLVLVKTLMATTLRGEAKTVVSLLTTLFQVLIVTESERVSEVPRLWVTIAFNCLRCPDSSADGRISYGIREMGFFMMEEALRTISSSLAVSRSLGVQAAAAHLNSLMNKTELDALKLGRGDYNPQKRALETRGRCSLKLGKDLGVILNETLEEFMILNAHELLEADLVQSHEVQIPGRAVRLAFINLVCDLHRVNFLSDKVIHHIIQVCFY